MDKKGKIYVIIVIAIVVLIIFFWMFFIGGSKEEIFKKDITIDVENEKKKAKKLLERSLEDDSEPEKITVRKRPLMDKKKEKVTEIVKDQSEDELDFIPFD